MARVEPASQREYGFREIDTVKPSVLLEGMRKVWMSHGDRTLEAPPGFEITARTEATIAAMENPAAQGLSACSFIRKSRTPKTALHCFGDSFSISADARVTGQLDRSSRTPSSGFESRSETDGLFARSAAESIPLLPRRWCRARSVIGLIGVFVNTGLLRKNEYEKVLSMLQNNLHLNVRGVDASERFLNMLSGVTDPEKKRKSSATNSSGFSRKRRTRIGDVDFLVQGTLYPDVIESVSVKGPSQTIKSHHNVGGLPERMTSEAGRTSPGVI